MGNQASTVRARIIIRRESADTAVLYGLGQDTGSFALSPTTTGSLDTFKMACHASEEGSGFPSERYCRDRHSAYKKLLADLAQHLGPEDVKVIVFNCSLSESLKQSSALDVLDYLDKHGKFSPTNIQPLAELLTDAYRSDLVNDYVHRYRWKYGTTKYNVMDPYVDT